MKRPHLSGCFVHIHDALQINSALTEQAWLKTFSSSAAISASFILSTSKPSLSPELLLFEKTDFCFMVDLAINLCHFNPSNFSSSAACFGSVCSKVRRNWTNTFPPFFPLSFMSFALAFSFPVHFFFLCKCTLSFTFNAFLFLLGHDPVLLYLLFSFLYPW